MPDVSITLAEQARALLGLEGLAVLMAIAYLLLAIRQNIWCWLCAGISTAIYVWLFVDARLYMESALNAFYFAMAVYGWNTWRSGASTSGEMPVTTWPSARHAAAVAAILLLAVANGYALSRWSDAAYPYVDSLTTWGAIWATFLVARKVLENWAYWLVIDLASIVIYWNRGLELTALLFVAYVVMIPFGYLSWRRSMPQSQ
ncbi:MAG: nicotinamide riboside transporter PnuC [Woeseiaceae bacterium]|nr:nicotinamide riboside transporter PnuC [Woeseiaceae bacterium]